MGLKPIPTQMFKKFLKQIGCVYVRTTGSHEIWNKKDGSLPRPITFRGAKKEVPPTHIRTNLWTLEMSVEEFQNVIESL
jgi:predicted RNA binding protein YcfA (HicA-like mRNA interferase family)